MAAGAWAGGAQLDFQLDDGPRTWDMAWRWRDAAGATHDAQVALPAAAVKADRQEVTWFPRDAMNQAVADDVRAWARGLQGVTLIVKSPPKGALSYSARGADKGAVKGALDGAEEAAEAATDRWLAEHDFTRLDGGLSFDHAGLVGRYAADVAPLAAALRAGTTTDRVFVDKALSFVQAIPYEARKRNGIDPGLRRPLSVLSANRGDCDSKTLLFLALVHAELPSAPLAVVYVPGHALGGVGLEAEQGDGSFKEAGVTYLYAEPVGPALHPLGQTDPSNKKAGKKGEVRPVP
jgi:transglutaminase-like putative cysteine protease